jgi:hypothetical protein
MRWPGGCDVPTKRSMRRTKVFEGGLPPRTFGAQARFARTPHLTVVELRSFAPNGAHAPALRPVALRNIALPCNPSHLTVLMLLPFGQSHSPDAISTGNPCPRVAVDETPYSDLRHPTELRPPARTPEGPRAAHHGRPRPPPLQEPEPGTNISFLRIQTE